MLCGSDEIGLTQERSGGIMALEHFGFGEEILEKHIGKNFFDLCATLLPSSRFPISVPMDEVVFEVDNKFITNRPDLFGVYGHAREMSTLFNLPLSSTELKAETIHSAEHIIDRAVIGQVSAYSLTSFDLQTVNQDTPDILKILLSRLGEKSHTIVADASILVMYEFGLPVHAYDADKIQGSIRVRYAQSGEQMIALGGKELTLSPQDIVISDEVGVIALAGVIGSERTSVSPGTKRVLLESACFDATSVRLTSARVGLRTGASMRYEKSQNPAMYTTAIHRFGEYMSEYFQATQGVTQAYFEPSAPHTILLDLQTLDERSGLHIPAQTASDILTKLGFEVTQVEDHLSVVIPSHRAQKDVTIEMDLIEEIARIYGYENIPSLPFPKNSQLTAKNIVVEAIKNIRREAMSIGMNEVYNYSFSNIDQNALFGIIDHQNSIALLNPNTTHQTHMRRAMAPLMVETIKENEKKSDTMKLFEVGRIHTKDTQEGFVETQKVIFSWYGHDHESVMRDVEVLESRIIPGSRRSSQDMREIASGYHPKRYTEIQGANSTIGHMGYVHPSILEHYELDKPCFLVEYDIASIIDHQSHQWSYTPLSRFQTTTRELNFLTPKEYSFAELSALIRDAHPLVGEVTHRENYLDDERFGHDRRSQIIRYSITPKDEGATDELLSSIQAAIIAHVESHSPAKLRRD